MELECAKGPVDTLNHIVARSTKNDKHVIMKYLSGIEDGEAFHESYREIAINMPQSSYDDYLKQIKAATKAGLRQDLGGSNIIIDAKSQKMIPIDYAKIAPGGMCQARIDKLGNVSVDPVICMYDPLFCNIFDDEFTSKALGKIFKAIANDIENPENIHFANKGDDFIMHHPAERILGREKAFEYTLELDDINQMRLKLLENNDNAVAKQLDEKIIQFNKKVDKNLIGEEPDIPVERLVIMQDDILNKQRN